MDLYSWAVFMNRAMSSVAAFIGRESEAEDYRKTADTLTERLDGEETDRGERERERHRPYNASVASCTVHHTD